VEARESHGPTIAWRVEKKKVATIQIAVRVTVAG
jgi:hypothetical protein